jgi:hypothetical protein
MRCRVVWCKSARLVVSTPAKSRATTGLVLWAYRHGVIIYIAAVWDLVVCQPGQSAFTI